MTMQAVTFALFQGKFLDYLNLTALRVILMKTNVHSVITLMITNDH